MRYAVVPIVAQQHRAQPSALQRDGVVLAAPQLSFDLSQLGAQPLRHGPPLDPEPPLAGLSAYVREAQKVEALGFGQPSFLAPLPSKATKLNQPRFVWVQLQAKGRVSGPLKLKREITA